MLLSCKNEICTCLLMLLHQERRRVWIRKFIIFERVKIRAFSNWENLENTLSALIPCLRSGVWVRSTRDRVCLLLIYCGRDHITMVTNPCCFQVEMFKIQSKILNLWTEVKASARPARLIISLTSSHSRQLTDSWTGFWLSNQIEVRFQLVSHRK